MSFNHYNPNFNTFFNTNSENNQNDNDGEHLKNTEESHLLIINSKDRNWSNTNKIVNNESIFDFNVKFAPSGNQGVFIGQSSLAHINKNYKDIVSLELLEIIIPDLYLDLQTLHSLADNKFSIIESSKLVTKNSKNIYLQKLSDLPYICLNIDEIGNTIDGTNAPLNSCTFLLTLDKVKDFNNNNSGSYTDNNGLTYEYSNLGKNVVAQTCKKMCTFKNITPWKKLYSPTPKNNINLLNIQLFDPCGNKIKMQNDYLEVNSIGLCESDTSGSVTELVSDSVVVSNAFESNQTNIDMSDFSTNNFGKDLSINISTSSDGKTITANISGGTNFQVGDAIKIIDPGSTNNTAIFFVKSISGVLISLNTKKYFSPEEYQVGDNILINNIKLDNSDYLQKNIISKYDLENFIKQDKGHTIVGLNESLESTSNSTCKMFNQIQIPMNYTINLDNGQSSIIKDFNLQSNLKGKLKNTDLSYLDNLKSLVIGNISDSMYLNNPKDINNYYNDKNIIITNGDNKNTTKTISNYYKKNKYLVANISIPLNIKCSNNDSFRINMMNNVNSGRILNLTKQSIYAFKINTLKKDTSFFK